MESTYSQNVKHSVNITADNSQPYTQSLSHSFPFPIALRILKIFLPRDRLDNETVFISTAQDPKVAPPPPLSKHSSHSSAPKLQNYHTMSPRLNKAIQKARIAAREASLSPHSKRVRKAARKAENRATRLVTKQLLAKQFSFSEWSEELKICHADFARLKRLASREGNNCDRVLLLELSLASYKRALVTVLRNTAEVEEGCAARCGMRSGLSEGSV